MQTDQPTRAHLGLILHWTLVDIRNLSYEAGNEKWISKAADFAEIIPLQLVNRDDDYLNSIVSGLRDWGKTDPRAARYASILDFSPEQVFRQVVPNDIWAEEEPGVQMEPAGI